MTASRFDSAYHAPVLVAEVLDALTCSPARGACSTARSAAAATRSRSSSPAPTSPASIAIPRRSPPPAQRLDAFAARGPLPRDPVATSPTSTQSHELDGIAFDGILLDLGVSSHQFDDEARGFSFREGAPLDMRMAAADRRTDGTADRRWLLNPADEHELAADLQGLSATSPRAAASPARSSAAAANRPFATSDDFVGAIRAVLGPRSGPGDFARLFQALRIAVNGELDALARALPALRDRLAPAGVLAVIAYHSGEDRIVKHAFREWSLSCVCPPKQLVCTCRGRPLGELLTRKAVIAGPDEVARNPARPQRASPRLAEGHQRPGARA